MRRLRDIWRSWRFRWAIRRSSLGTREARRERKVGRSWLDDLTD